MKRQATDNRLLMPQVSAWVDAFRAIGVNVRVTFAEENGIRMGRPLDESRYHVVAAPPLSPAFYLNRKGTS
jgi:hypothetical protein